MATNDAPVIIVGGGLAGLVAATELSKRKVRTIIIDQENEASLGGQAFWSLGGLFIVNSANQRRMGIKDSRELAMQDWFGTARFDREKEDYWPKKWAEAFVNFATDEFETYVREHGITFTSVGWAERGSGSANGHGNSVPRFHLTWGTGPAVVEAFEKPVREAAKNGLVEFRFRHRVDEIIVDEDTGAAVGIRGQVLEPSETERGVASNRNAIDSFEIRGSHVIVTSGGIGGNVDMVRKNWPVDRLGPHVPKTFVVGVPAHVDGRMIDISQQAGANIINSDRMWHYTEGLHNWNPIWPNHGIRVLPGPTSLWLDATGKRLPPFLFPGSDTLETLKYICSTGYDYSWFVLNKTIVAKEFGLSGSEQNPDVTGKSILRVLQQRLFGSGPPAPVQAFLDNGQDFIVEETLPQLVDKMNKLAKERGGPILDDEQVKREIEYRDNQVDNIYTKDAQIMLIENAQKYWPERWSRVTKLHKILDPAYGPLIAVRMNILTRKTLGGLETNLDANVLRQDGSVFPNLYAAGEVSGFGGGGVHGYSSLEGTFLGGCIFSGRTAGIKVAEAHTNLALQTLHYTARQLPASSFGAGNITRLLRYQSVSQTLAASWCQYPERSSRRYNSGRIHPASVGRKLPLSARKYQLALMGKTPHIGVIGAGVSGLRCADILGQNGAKVTILEARDRIGGRIHQVEVDGHLVDLGANWIHGSEGNPIDQISKTSNTTTCDWDGKETVYDTSGEPFDEATTMKMAAWMWSTIDEGFEYSTKNKDTIPPSMSLYDFCCQQLEKTDFTEEEKTACREFSKFWGAYVGERIERQSMKFFCLEECIDGTNLFVASTYKNILAHISKAALKHADLRLTSPVVQIEAGERNLASERHITVTIANGEKYHFDDVIVTCPLGWLKKNKSVFSPPLPPRLSSAVDNISFGRLEKIYVTFPSAWWHIPIDQKSATTSGTGMPTVTNGSQVVPGPDGDNYPPAFTQWLEPKYVTAPAEDGSWNMQTVSMAALPPNCAHPTLLFYIYGECSSYVVSNIKDLDESSPEYYAFLDNFVRPFYSLLPGYSASSEASKPSTFLASKWISDDYAGNGSYANFMVGLEAGDRDIEAMRAGMGPDRGVWFAGEHTAPFVGLGTTTGAYWSGERAAGQICDLYGLGQVGLGTRKDDSLPTERPSGVINGDNTMLHKGNTAALKTTVVTSVVEASN